MLLILLVTIDVGRLFYGWVNLQNTARIGANFAALHPTAWGATPNAALQADYAKEIRDDAAKINCVLPATIPAPTFLAGGATSLGEARVDLSCDFGVLAPSLIGIPTFHLGASSNFPIRSGDLPVPAPTPTPPPTPTPAPTPTPTAMCTVPSFMGSQVDNAAISWIGAGFEITDLNISLGNGNYSISSESGGNLGQPLVPGNYDGQSQNCATFVLTVGP